jgi:hypothetical protein
VVPATFNDVAHYLSLLCGAPRPDLWCQGFHY